MRRSIRSIDPMAGVVSLWANDRRDRHWQGAA